MIYHPKVREKMTKNRRKITPRLMVKLETGKKRCGSRKNRKRKMAFFGEECRHKHVIPRTLHGDL